MKENSASPCITKFLTLSLNPAKKMVLSFPGSWTLLKPTSGRPSLQEKKKKYMYTDTHTYDTQTQNSAFYFRDLKFFKLTLKYKKWFCHVLNKASFGVCQSYLLLSTHRLFLKNHCKSLCPVSP